jgi:sugar lactone lactonase YvrE
MPVFPMPLGINGIRVQNQMVYFSNSAKQTFGRVSIDIHGSVKGRVEILAKVISPDRAYDDFALDQKGSAWIATHSNSINRVVTDGNQTVVAGGGASTELVEPTSAVFGRGSKKEEGMLYVTTAGGQVAAIDTSQFH